MTPRKSTAPKPADPEPKPANEPVTLETIARQISILSPSVVTDGWVLGPETIGVLRQMGQLLEAIHAEMQFQRVQTNEMYETFKELKPTIAGARFVGKITNPFRSNKGVQHGTPINSDETGTEAG